MPKQIPYLNELEQAELLNQKVHGVPLPIETIEIVQAKAIAEILANLIQISASLERISQALEQHGRTVLEDAVKPAQSRKKEL